MTTRPTITEDAFEKLGYDIMSETQSKEQAIEICGLKLNAYADERMSEVKAATAEIALGKARHESLCAFLYDRPLPVSDGTMLSKKRGLRAMLVVLLFVGAASITGHSMTFALMGMSLGLSMFLGASVTGLAAVAGHKACEALLSKHVIAEAVVGVIAAALCFWGLLQFAQARGSMTERLTHSNTTASSYVDDTNQDDVPSAPSTQSNDEHSIRELVGSAMAKIMVAADLALGVVLNGYVRRREDEDLVAWTELGKISKHLQKLQADIEQWMAQIEMAKKRCMAGILRAVSKQRKPRPPYHRALVAFAAFVLLASALPMAGQSKIDHHEGVLIDASGSIGQGSANRELFREYLNGAKKLLASEPPRTRIWVQQITTESFGSSTPLLRGWTPDVQGVFTDDLSRARRQLVASFEAKSSAMSPIAAGTDIFGGLWSMKALLESGFEGKAAAKEIWIFSDMMNETVQFNMPALVPRGPEAMVELAKSHGLLLDLKGYKVHVVGASTAGSTPQMWNVTKHFWERYFRAAGADLVTYSAETDVSR